MESLRKSIVGYARQSLRWCADLIVITAAAAVYAAGLNAFVSPNGIAPGGVTGIAIIISEYSGVSVGTLYAALNVPLVAAGFFLLDKKVMIRTLYSVAAVTFMTDCALAGIPVYSAEDGNGILAAVFGGLLMGLGLGLNYIREGTTGGIDIVNKIISRFIPGLKLGRLTLISDGVVVALGFLAFGDLDAVMYALIAIFVTSRVVDAMVYGGQECRFLLVFSERSEDIAGRLIREDLGVTLLKSEGAYSRRESSVVAAAVHKGDYVRARRAIRLTDPKAFVVITSASEVLGNGFQKLE